MTDQFCGPYSIARPAKFERFLSEPPIDLRYNEYLTNLVFLGPSTLAILGTLRSDDGGCLRRRAEVGNICLRISGSRRVRFPALAVLSETSKRSVCRLV